MSYEVSFTDIALKNLKQFGEVMNVRKRSDYQRK